MCHRKGPKVTKNKPQFLCLSDPGNSQHCGTLWSVWKLQEVSLNQIYPSPWSIVAPTGCGHLTHGEFSLSSCYSDLFSSLYFPTNPAERFSYATLQDKNRGESRGVLVGGRSALSFATKRARFLKNSNNSKNQQLTGLFFLLCLQVAM